MFRRVLSIVACAMATMVPAFATETATLQLTGTNGGANLGGVYTSPYFATITTGSTTISSAVICDDFADDSYLGETWTADVTHLSDLSSPNSLKWQGTTWQGQTLTQAQEYMAAALLVEDLLPVYSTDAYKAGEYGFAIWALLDPADNPLGYIGNSNTVSQVKTYINSAVAEVSGSSATTLSQFSNVNIYTYDSALSLAAGQPSGCGGCAPSPQEFIAVSMAEPPAPLLLLFYFSIASGLVFVFRRRMFKA
jgi:hypothetical protein